MLYFHFCEKKGPTRLVLPPEQTACRVKKEDAHNSQTLNLSQFSTSIRFAIPVLTISSSYALGLIAAPPGQREQRFDSC